MPELKLENSIVDDRYLVERCLGRGSYAEIFLAYDRARNQEPVIIKALNTSLQGTLDAELEQTLVENFQNEAIALDRVRHPHIIRRLGHGTAADLRGILFHYLLLEYMPGGDLLSFCRRRPFDLETVMVYFRQVAEALAYAHSQHVIHRDIKPNNLLLSADHHTIKIADFGVAKMAMDDAAEITRVGTNVYAPPEHHPDSPEEALNQKLTPSADVYSLAKTIYTAMTGRAPRQFARLPITDLPAELAREPWGGDLLAVLKKATAFKTEDRYQTVQQFWEEFARLGSATAEGADPEATVVRARLVATSTAGRAAARPDFHALSTARYDAPPQKARIIVELPQNRPATSGDDTVTKNGKETVASAAAPPSSPASRITRTDAAGSTGQIVAGEREAADLRTKRLRERHEIERTAFDNMRLVVNSEWLRRVFIVFLFAAFIGLAISTYHYCAGIRTRQGTISGAMNVNLRSGPGGDVVAVLPEGTRVRVFEYRSGWARVKVLQWPGGTTENTADAGWLDGRFIRLD
ncbi:MAG TPA: serine/threonine protein kinase [Blastocatellia bacterium]|nr:serine/threonine protein kinase [Blastocatellia bacterium]